MPQHVHPQILVLWLECSFGIKEILDWIIGKQQKLYAYP